ncbi:MAG: M81 family metallopeptidase [Rubrivivax sp.]
MQRAPRIGLCGFFLEANRFAPPTTGAHFEQACDLAGAALARELQAAQPRLLGDLPGFASGMGSWEPVALRVAAAYPGGPVEDAWFEAFLEDLQARLRAAGPLDGVYISSHGAALAASHDDPDGELFQCVRRIVGPEVPVVAVLDLHTNVSARMTDALSAFVAYRTNPHVDLRERGQEAAALMRRMLEEGPGEVALVKLPFLPASTDQLIAPGTPYHALVQEGQEHLGPDVLNVSLCGGFPLADCAKCGFSVVVTARRGARTQAESVARTMAARVWARRAAFLTALTPLARAVELAVQAGLSPVDGGDKAAAAGSRLILADVADNPGGGGSGRTTVLLRAQLQAGAQGVLLGVYCDPALAAQAHERGRGARFEAMLNRDEAPDSPFGGPLVHSAEVLALSDGDFVGRKGLVKGMSQRMGPSARLALGAGVQVVVISRRQQLLDPAQLEALDVDLGRVRTLVVKSRGHFRAAFDDFAPASRIIEVDCPGLTTPNLATLPLARVPRPAYPLQRDTAWPAPAGDAPEDGAPADPMSPGSPASLSSPPSPPAR